MFLPVGVKFMDFHGDLIVFLFTLAYTLSNVWFRNLSPMLSFNVMVLAVLPLGALCIIIKRLEFEFDSCHLSSIDHSDQKKINFFLIFILILFYI